MLERDTLADQAARDLIGGRLDINLVVEAGAGSGKTESLARRMAAGIVEGRYEVEGMAAVTFTRKAAAELRGRFQIELERRLRSEQEAPRRERIEYALSHLERLFAGTIHAFCAHLLRERPVEAGVAPGFVELEDDADAEMRRRAWRDHLDRERACASPVLRELLDAGVAPHTLDDAFAKVCLYPDVAFPPGEAAAPETGPAWLALEAFWDRLRPLLPRPIPDETTCKVLRAARELPGRLAVADRSRPAALADLLVRWEGEPEIVQKWWAETRNERQAIKAALETMIRGFREATVDPFLAAWRRYVYRLAVTLFGGGRELAAAARRRAVALNYWDLLQVASRLLRERADVREALRRKVRWLFVDEFQDTDPIQAEVILLLAGEVEAGGDWAAVPLRPGGLFIVGDPKQSIYRFRRADIDTYMRVKARIAATGGQAAELVTSFRAVPALCRWANGAFGGLMPATATPQQPAFLGLRATRPEGDPAATGVRQIVIPAAVEEAGVPAFDAGAIAHIIRAEVDGGRRAWGDFLILTRKKRHIPAYALALEALRIPVEVSGGAAFAGSPAVAALAALLRALGDPDDGTALVGVLRGPLFGLSDAELFQHREAGFRFGLTAPLPDEATGPVPDALRGLRAMYRWTHTLPAPAAVERTLEATGVLAMAVAAAPGGIEGGNLLHAVDRVRRVTEEGGTLADAVAALEEDIESSDVESVPLEPGRRNVVRLMNLHKAKGLEAPVVFLADPLGGVEERADIRVVRDGPRAEGYLRVTRPRGEWGKELVALPERWDEHEAAELDYVRAEERRLLYVAATRAGDLLVVSRWDKAGGRGTRPWEPLAPYLRDAPVLAVPEAVALPPGRPADLGPGARSQAAEQRAETLTAASAPSWRVESVTATARRAGPALRAALPTQASEAADRGAAWGRLIHAMLEAAMRGGDGFDEAALARLAVFLVADEPVLRASVPEAVQMVRAITQSDVWRRARAAPERHVEVPFAVQVPTEELRDAGPDAPPVTVLQGVVDLAYRVDGAWELVDYKTDVIAGDLGLWVEHYAPQVRLYARHWAAITGEPVARAGLFFIRPNRLVWLP